VNKFAPVLICTLNRYVHFKRCVESLAACTHADKTDLFIGLDYPSKDTHWEGYRMIKAYLPNIKGFRTVSIVERDKNYGVEENWSNMQDHIFSMYDRLISSEDDNEFSPNFLDYLNKGLDKFENDPRIYAICGYNYPIEIPQNYSPNYYFGRTFAAWGIGRWKTRHEEFMREWNYNMVVQKLKKTREAFKVRGYINSFLQIVSTGYIFGDIIIAANLELKNMYCVLPVLTKVRNHGHDGSGANCGTIKGENIFLSQKLDTEELFVFSELPVNDADRTIGRLLHQYFSRPFRAKTKTLLRYVLYRITGKSFGSSDLKRILSIIKRDRSATN
jgi:hypothetical protein